MDWQTMDSAPKDGGEVLLFWFYYYPDDRHPTHGYVVGWWENGQWATDEGEWKEGTVSHWARPEPPPIPDRPAGRLGFLFPSDFRNPTPPQGGVEG